MPRKSRQLLGAGIYHIVAQGRRQRRLFFDKEDFEFYLGLLGRMKRDYRFEIYHYCLMPGQAHILMCSHEAGTLQKLMQRINLSYSKQYRRKYPHEGEVFQDRFRSFEVRQNSYLLECGRYIERNPLTMATVKDIDFYAWSSYRYYAHGDRNELITPNPLYVELDVDRADRRLFYRQLLAIERPYDRLITRGLLRG